MSAEEMQEAMANMQAQLARLSTENVALNQRVVAAEQTAQQVNVGSILQALQGLPEAISRLSKPKGLIDPKGLGKPQVLGDNPDEKFRTWAIKLEDYVTGVFGGKSREVLEWAAGSEVEITFQLVDVTYGHQADLLDQWDEVAVFDEQLYTVLRATTENIPFDLVENVEKGRGLEAWRCLHKKYDPSTGGRKRVMLHALTNPERATYETLGGAIERWKALRGRYDRKKDQFGNRESLPESLAMNAMEKLVPKELETHLMLNYARFKCFEEMEREVVNFVEAKLGAKLVLSSNFAKSSNAETIPMDVDSLVRAVSGTISSLVNKGKGKSAQSGKGQKFDGKCDLCGKVGHKKRDCWHGGKGGASPGGGKGKSTPRSNSSSPTKSPKFEGKCDNCGKVGHKRRDCWSKPQHSSGGKGKGRGKEANSLDGNQPEQEPQKEANGLEICAISAMTEDEGNSRSRSPTPGSEDWSTVSRRVRSYAGSEESAVINGFNEEHPGWVKCNLDTGASVTAIPKEFKPNGVPGQEAYKTASGELIHNYGKVRIRGTDEGGVMRILNGNATDVQKVLVSASKLHQKGYCSWIGPGGGEIFPMEHPINVALGKAYAKAVEQYGKDGLIPLREERGVYNFYIKIDTDYVNEEVESEAVSAVGSSTIQDPEDPSSPKIMTAKPKVKFNPTVETYGKNKKNPPWRRGQINALEDEVEEIGPEGPSGDSEEVESRAVNPGWSPPDPTPAEVREHEASGHAVFRNWCQDCVKAKGVSQQHRRVDHSGDLLPTIGLDYFYMNEDRQGDASRPGLVAIDRDTGMMFATAVERKGVIDPTAQKLLTKFIELLGYKELVMKSDGERPLVRLKIEAAKAAKGLRKAVNEESPQGDSKANGMAEAAVKEVKWRIRAIHLMLNKKFNVEVNQDHPLITWVPRYAAEQCNRFKVGNDGRTPEERRTGKKWVKPMPVFGEKILVKPAGKGKRGDPAKMVEGRYVGIHNRFGSVLAMTKTGVVVGTGFHLLPEAEKWGELEEDLKGAPWDVANFALKKVEQIPEQMLVVPAASLPQVPAEEAGDPGFGVEQMQDAPQLGGPSGGMARPEGPKARAWPVRRDMLAKFGKTPGCDGCLSIDRPGFQQVAHSEECRSRIRGRIDEEKQKDAEVRAKQAAEDEAEERRRADKRERLDEGDPNLRSGPSGSRGSQPSSKRKGGDEGVTDINDLVAEAELEEAAGSAQAEAVEEQIEKEVVSTLMDLGALDVLEVFSPQRMTKGLRRFGLRDGVAIDIEEMKPNGEERWNLDRAEDYELLMEMIYKEEPLLLTASPPCSTFSRLRNLSNFKRDPEIVAEEEEVGRGRLRKAVGCCKMQDDEGRFYLFEHPKEATSWNEPELEELRQRSTTYEIVSPMCKFHMKAVGPDGQEGHVRKMTRWLTNSPAIAEELTGTCANELAGKEIHRHIHLIGGGRAKAAQVYPVMLVNAVLRGLKKEMQNAKMINSLEEEFTGPSPDNYVEWEHEVATHAEAYVDDVTGAPLDPELVQKARQEELDWLRREEVYERVPKSQCEEKGAKLLKLKWLDINKGDEARPKIRSRIVTKEVKKAKAPHEQLSNDAVFASTPPAEAVATLFSLFMSGKRRRRKMGLWDISRAHFMGRAARELYIELPPEDKRHDDDECEMVGILRRSMYGTQDAARIFQEDYQQWLKENGAEFSKICPAMYKFKEKDLIGLVHGDDFVAVGTDESLMWLDEVLNKKYKARWEAKLGDGEKDDKEAFFLNRLIRYVPDGTDHDGERLEVEADARHAEILIRGFGFDEKTKGAEIPEEKMTDKDVVDEMRQPVLGSEQTSEYRSMVMRLAYMSVDRPDLAHAVRMLATAMKSPKAGDWGRLKRVVRYLVKYPYMKRVYFRQKEEDIRVVAWSDSDWAGDKRSRKSTTGSVIKIGNHTVLAKAATQKVVALSSGEAEYYGMCRTGTLATFVQGALEFWVEAQSIIELRVDSTAAKAMAERRGVGQTRHIQARYLWLQDQVFERKMAVKKTDGKTNVADLTTKVQPKGVLKAHLKGMGYLQTTRRGHKDLT